MCCVSGEPRSAFRLTPLTSTLVGAVCAVLLIAAVVCVSVRLRCCSAAKRRAAKDAAEDDKGSLPGGPTGSPHSAKFDASATDGAADADEKNPDIIPLAGTAGKSRTLAAATSTHQRREAAATCRWRSQSSGLCDPVSLSLTRQTARPSRP